MDDFWTDCYTEAKSRGYDDAQARDIADRAKLRYDKGPWHKPTAQVASAVERLKAMEGDEAMVAALVSEMAAHFDADDFCEIARQFGIDGGLSTKAQAVRLVVERVCKEKADAKS